ncbi:MAG: nicotinamide riboside transporter PnuC [Prevotella sp.]|nr:nicotinamide riboside transporter PnuC [Prevotella sp.]
MTLIQFIADHGLDAFTTALGLLYIILEYRASIWLWLVGIVMPALDIYLYWSHGLYGDAGMAAYYTAAAIYGYAAWKISSLRAQKNPALKAEKATSDSYDITHFPVKKILPTVVFFFVAWAIVYYVLTHYTNSTIPVTDSFTNALSFVGLWALAKKYAEQWLIWIVVDLVSCYLYIVKGIPFKALLYGLYVVIAVLGYIKWIKMIQNNSIYAKND